MNKNCDGKRFARALSLFIILSILLSLAAAQAECLHANTYTEKSFDGYGEDFSPSQHIEWYEVRTYCSDCGIMISEDWTEEQSAHSVINGACSCGYSDDAPCGHPVRNDGSFEMEYESVSSGEHAVIRWVDTVCGLCGEIVDVNGDDLGTEPHDFGGGSACTKCGYQKQQAAKFCSRCNEMRTWSDIPNYTLYSQMANGQHSKWSGTVEKCNHCGYAVEKKMDSQVFENHTFIDGKCVCGAKETSATPTAKPTFAPCDHSGTTVYDRVDVFTYTYSQRNASEHIKHTRDQVFCPCGAVVYENNWSNYEPHAMSSGYCIYCGYGNQTGNTNNNQSESTNNKQPAATEAPSGFVSMKKGSASNTPARVKELQKLLIENGYDLPRYGADGDFGSETTAAVEKFQADHGLPVTGIVDEITWNKLVNPNEEDDPSEPEACEHLYSTPHREEGSFKYFRCILCNNELLVVSDAPDSFEESLVKFAQDAAEDGSETNRVYDKLLDASRKTAFNQLFSEIMDGYQEKGVWQTSTENLYNFMSDIPGAIGSLFTDEDDFEAKFNAKLENNIKRALIQQNQNAFLNLSDIKDSYKVWDTACSAANEFVGMALDGKDTGILKKADLAGKWSGYAMTAVGFAIETVDIVNCTYGEIAMLGSLVASYDYNMTMLDAMIEQNGSDSAIGQACQRIKEDMTSEFEANARNIGEANMDILGEAFETVLNLGVDNLLGDLSTKETFDLMYAKVTDQKIEFLTKTFNNPNFLKVTSGIASGILLGSKIGAIVTNDTGVMLDAKEEILINATMESMIRRSVEDAYDDRSSALQPLTQLWIVTQMDGLDATEKYVLAYEHEAEKHFPKTDISLGKFVFRLMGKRVSGGVGGFFTEKITQGADIISDVSLDLIFGDLNQRANDIENQKASIREDKTELKEVASALGFSYGISFPPYMLFSRSVTPPAGDSLETPVYYEYLPYTLCVYKEPNAGSEPIARLEISENGLWLPYDEVRSFTQDGKTWTEAQYNETSIYFTADAPLLDDALKLWGIDAK